MDKSKTALQADNRTLLFLLGFANIKIKAFTVSESEAISWFTSSETSEAAPMISAARHAILEVLEVRRVGSKARMGLTEDCERREGSILSKHLLMSLREGEWGFETDASNNAKMALESES